MQAKGFARMHAVFCTSLYLVAVLATKPFTDSGINDDWSYIRTAQIFAQTGHIVYNGWGAPLLGWMLVPAALLIHLFGSSFTVVRMSCVLIGAAIAFVTQRTFVRLGLTEWNASLATLCLVLCPIFIPVSTNFMTDIPGLFALILCLYACVRATQAGSDASAIAWLCFAAISNDVLGTARQISWVGALVLVPSAAWAMRSRRGMAVAGALCWVSSVAFILLCMRWFSHQFGSVADPIFNARLSHDILKHFANAALRCAASVALVLLPVTAACVGIARKKSFRIIAPATALYFLFYFVQTSAAHHPTTRDLFDRSGNYFTSLGVLSTTEFRGDRDGWPPLVCNVLLFVVIASASVLLTMLVQGLRERQSPVRTSVRLALLLPVTLAYAGFLLPRAAYGTTFDRYLLFLLFAGAFACVFLYQRFMQKDLPGITAVLVCFMAVYSVVSTHDMFATYRAVDAAAAQIAAAGIPRTEFDPNWEFDGLTEITNKGIASVLPDAIPHLAACQSKGIALFPSITGHYTLAPSPTYCGGQPALQPVLVLAWAPGSRRTLYIVKLENPG